VSGDIPHVAGVEHEFVDAGGLRTHVALAGAGEPVVLLHGWPQHWYVWRDVIPLVAPHARVIAPDLRGFGWTDVPRDGFLIAGDAWTRCRAGLAVLPRPCSVRVCGRWATRSS